MSRPEIRVHPEEGWIAIRDRPDSDRPWAKVVPGISLTDDDVADWTRYEPAIPADSSRKPSGARRTSNS